MTGNPYITLGAEALKNAAGGAAGPSTANNKGESAFGGGGFSVIFGNGNTQTTATETPKSSSGVVSGYVPYALALAGVIVVWKMLKKH